MHEFQISIAPLQGNYFSWGDIALVLAEASLIKT